MDGKNTTRRLAGLALGAVLISALLSSCGLGGSCTEADLQLAEQIPAYGGTQLEYSEGPDFEGCAAVLEVEADPDEVLDHYRGALEADGWTVSVEDTLVEGPEGATAVQLIARRGESTFEIALESFDDVVNAAIYVNENADS
jgi:hypothetical protein